MKSESLSARSSRQSAGLQSVLKLLLAAIILILINYVAFRHYTHKDLSESQFYTLSDKTKDVLRKLDAPVQIYTFLNEQAGGQTQQIENLLKEYQSAGGKNLTVEKIDPAYDMKRATDLQKQLHFDGNDHLLILQYKDRSPRFVKQDDMFDLNPMTGQVGAFKGEQQLTSAIVAVVEGKASKVYFTEGHGEHSIHDLTNPQGYGGVGELVKNDNIDITTLNLAEQGQVPADADAVVIAGPQISFAPIEVDAIDRYLANNGKLMILIDPYATTGLEAALAKFGLKYEDDLVLQRLSQPPAGDVTLPVAVVYQGGFSPAPITTKFAQNGYQLIIQDARSITLPTPPPSGPPAKTQFLLQTPPDSWGWISKVGGAPPDPKSLTYNKTTDIGGPLTIAAQYDGGTTTDPNTKATMLATRIVAVGASKFLENDTANEVSANFFTNAIDWLVKKDATLDIAPKKPMQYGVNLSPLSYNAVVWTAAFVIPGAALLFGIATWFSRRK
jgi:ABC-type uncharacterized transport system involved in gliding motility auxiliary subunit